MTALCLQMPAKWVLNSCKRQRKRRDGPFKCAVCQKGFCTAGTLKLHTQKHLGIFKYRCSVCGKGFTVQSNMEGHMFRHTGIKQYKCQFCDREYAYKHKLKDHYQLAHPNKDAVILGKVFM